MPMHSLPPSGDAQEIWGYLKRGTSDILRRNNEGLEQTKYMNLYTAVYNYCTSLKSDFLGSSQITLGVSGSGAMLYGEQLYKLLTKHIKEYMSEVSAQSLIHKDDDLLEFYTNAWNKYVDSSKVIHNIFAYLNRHWIKREQDEGRNISDVNTLMLQIWRDQLFLEIRSSLMESVLSLMKRIRDGEVADINMVKSVADSFVSLGLDDSSGTQRRMEVYKKYFQTPFINDSKQYYEVESTKLLQEGSIRNYMAKITIRLQEEDDRAPLYLHPESINPLKDALNNALIGKHEKRLVAEFQSMLEAQETDNLHNMFKLILRLGEDNGLGPLRKTFTQHILRAGRDAIKPIKGNDYASGSISSEACLFIDALLNVHDTYSKILHVSFEDNPGFSKALDNAFKEFVNTNAICPDGESRAPMLLAYYCDSLLKKGGANARKAGAGNVARTTGMESGGDLENLLSQAIRVFRYIKDSDVFQKFYSRFLARRLVNEQSVSIDAEETMISKLKEVSGTDFTAKLSRMFTDMNISADLNEAFHNFLGDSSSTQPQFTFNMKVLHSVSWPLNLPDTAFTPSSQLGMVCDSFNRFYQSKHNGRKLNWLWQHSKAEIKMFFPNSIGPAAKAGYIFQVTTYQLAILLLFTADSGLGTGYNSINGPTLTWSQISQSTGLSDDAIRSEIDVLCRARILLCSTDEIGSSSSFKLNPNFKSKKLKINLAGSRRPEQKRETNETMKSVSLDRMYSIQAAIVRIMKARKTLNHRNLVEATISQIKLFQAQVGDIKKAIDALIEREYLERDSSNRDLYKYLA